MNTVDMRVLENIIYVVDSHLVGCIYIPLCLNAYDYGARQLNPVIGRWDRMDPLCEKYYNVSPYAYCHDNPVMLVDPDGRDDYYDSFGNFLGSNNHKTDYIYIADKYNSLGKWSGQNHYGIISRTSLADADLLAKAWSKILTRIVINAGVDADVLYNGAISVGVLTTTNNNIT